VKSHSGHQFRGKRDKHRFIALLNTDNHKFDDRCIRSLLCTLQCACLQAHSNTKYLILRESTKFFYLLLCLVTQGKGMVIKMDINNITKKALANMFDHTNLKAYATDSDFEKLCKEADENGFKMVAINSSPVALCKNLLMGSPVHVGAAIGFPLGQTTIETKAFETENAIENGADEIDYVINVGELKKGNLNYIREEMETIVGICKKKNVLSKVIFEICYLTEEEIIETAKIAKEVKPDFVKTSTGFGTGGATVEAVRLMKKVVGEDVKVKAAGGIRDLDTCLAMIEAGAERIGTSNSLKILKEFDEKYSEM